MFKELFRLTVLAVLFIPGMAGAQAVGTITGTVTDPNGVTVPGVNITLDGTSFGTASDFEGNYSFTAPAGSYTLAATFVGYERFQQPVTVTAGQTVRVDIRMAESRITLDEVVVTALGIEREERSIGYSVQEVEPEALTRADESNLVNALAGKVAGVQINSSSGQPGKSSRITIRGVSSMLGNNQPLFVIDGIPVSNDEDDQPEEVIAAGSNLFSGGTTNRGVDIDPNIIEDITVLKGASATALYGSRAANGAIVITTKRARAAQRGPSVTLSSKVRWDDAIIEGFQDQYLQGSNGYYVNGLPLTRGGYIEPDAIGIDGLPVRNSQTTLNWGPHRDSVSTQVLSDLGVGAIPTYDPRDAFYQTGAVLDNSLSIAGGTTDFNYFLNVSDLDQEGIVPGTRLDRTSFMAKFGAQLGSKVNVETSANYITTGNSWLAEGNGAQAYLYGLNFTPISFDITQTTFEDGAQRMHTANFNNPLWLSENNQYRSDVNRLIASSRVGFKILPWLELSERFGIDTYADTRKQEVNIGTVGTPNGRMYDQNVGRSEINSDLTLQMDRPLSSSFAFTALIGNNINKRNYNFNYVRGRDLSIPGFYNVGNAAVVNGYQQEQEQLLTSVYSQVTLDYRQFAYLTLTGRNDWSSTLPAGNNSYFYPSASLGFVFTEPLSSFFDKTPLSFGKLRASIAQIGSDAPVYSLSTTYFQAAPGDGQRGEILYPFNGLNGFEYGNIQGNPDLKPEISTEYEVGLDLRFWGQKVRLDAAYYDRSTRDQIFTVPMSAATGYVARILNAGEIRNYGTEVTLGFTPIETRDFQLDFQANWSKNTTEVVKLTEGVESIFLAGFENPQIRIQPGKNGYGVIWGTRYERNDQGQILIDDDGYPILANDLGAIGNVMPDWVGNLRSTVTFKGLSLSALVDVRQGGDILNFDSYYSVYYGTSAITADRGEEMVWEGVVESTGQPNTKPIVKDEFWYRALYTNSYENLVEDGSFIKLREISLTYTIPQRWAQLARLQSASITATGRNLWIKSDFTYGDPEGSLIGSGNGQGFYHMVTPSTKSWSVGVRLTI